MKPLPKPIRRLLVSCGVAAFVLLSAPEVSAQSHSPGHHRRAPSRRAPKKFVATAYAQYGLTKSGVVARPGIVAADPAVLPLGSVIRVSDPKGYSGEYEVLDTGSKVKGRHIDIFMWDRDEAVEFGRHKVTVEVVRLARAATRNAAESD